MEMNPFNRPKTVPSTPFSDFFRNTQSRDKNKVYKEVLERATERQREVIERAKSAE